MPRDPESPPSEMLSQMLFAVYANEYAQRLGKRIVFFAPTQPEEEQMAYDVALLEVGCRELYLQFKRAEQGKPDRARLRVKIDNKPSAPSTLGQLDRLSSEYPPRSAFYVAGAFWNLDDTFLAQHMLAGPSGFAVADFLDIYAAVRAEQIALPAGQKTSTMHLDGQFDRGVSRTTRAVQMCKGGPLYSARDWFFGSQLLHEFLTKGARSTVGCFVQQDQQGNVVRLPNQQARDITSDRQFPVRRENESRENTFDRQDPMRRENEGQEQPPFCIRVFDEAQA